MGELAQIAVGKPVGDRSGERGSYRPHAQPNSFATCRHGNVRAHSANSPSCSRRSLCTSLQFPQDTGIVAQPFLCLTSPARLQPIDHVYLTNHIAKEVC